MKNLRTSILSLALVAAPCLLLAQGKATLTALRSTPAQSAMYKLSVELENELQADARVQIAFPEQFDLSAIKIAGSNDIKGGFRVETDRNTLTLKRTGLGAVIPAEQKVSIIFGPLKNPDNLADDHLVEITIPRNTAASDKIREKINFNND